MIKAHSLLYAVYVCLIIAILCGCLIMLSNLYNQLNLYYVTHESLYIKNQSAVNYALGNNVSLEEDYLTEKETGITSQFQIKQHGLLPLLLTQTYVSNDTVSSAHFIGQKDNTNTALYVANFSYPLNTSGKVTVKGDAYLPSERLKEIYIDNKPNEVNFIGKKEISTVNLPETSTNIKNVYNNSLLSTSLSQVEKRNDSIYVNSFFNETIKIQLQTINLENMVMKGNFILSSNDSIFIRKNNVLEDVVIIAPKVGIEEGFKGNIQVFARESITVEQDVVLNYPSVLCVYSDREQKTFLNIDENVQVYGLVMLFGNKLIQMDKNNMNIKEKGTIIGNVYCSGILSLRSNVYGGVYATKIQHKTNSSTYMNCIADIEIDISKKPKIFKDISIFNAKNSSYEIIKKAL